MLKQKTAADYVGTPCKVCQNLTSPIGIARRFNRMFKPEGDHHLFTVATYWNRRGGAAVRSS